MPKLPSQLQLGTLQNILNLDKNFHTLYFYKRKIFNSIKLNKLQYKIVINIITNLIKCCSYGYTIHLNLKFGKNN